MDLIGGYPFSLIRNGLPFDYPKLQDDEMADVLILGAGISGALSAFYLLQAGFSCVMLDSRTAGLGSTCASTSLLQYELDAPLAVLGARIGPQRAARAYQLCSLAIDALEKISAVTGFENFVRTPSVWFADDPKRVDLVQREFIARREAGFDVELLDEAALSKRFHFSAPAAIVSAQGACMDAYRFTHALLQHGIKHGLRVYDRTKAIGVRYEKNGVEARAQNGRTVRAKFLVNATGYEALRSIDASLAELRSTYAVATDQLGTECAFPFDCMLWNTADPYLYMRRSRDGRIIAGGRDEFFYDPAARDRLIAQKSKQLQNDVSRLFPGFEFPLEFGWAGTFAVTKDSLPFIGPCPQAPHTFFALGFGGNGITFSAVAASLLADFLRGKKDPDLGLFSFSRKIVAA